MKRKHDNLRPLMIVDCRTLNCIVSNQLKKIKKYNKLLKYIAAKVNSENEQQKKKKNLKIL